MIVDSMLSRLRATALRRGKLFLVFWLLLAGMAHAADETPMVKLFVREAPVKVYGKTVKMAAIEQADGTQGYSPEESKGFHAEVINQLPVPTCIHWHGLVLPNLDDGVPFVTQNPIPPGGSRRYDFPLRQSGSYWMHSHYGLQEQYLVAAPMIIRSPARSKVADSEVAVMLGDFSFASPQEILSRLKGDNGGMEKPGMKPMAMKPMAMKAEERKLLVQRWNPDTKRFVPAEVMAAMPDIDVKYDALLANRRTIDDPEVVEVKPGQKVLLRLIGASSATNFLIDTGSLEGTIVAVDGGDTKPLKGNFFQLALAQRLDLVVTIPKAGGAFPILALGEGTALRAGIVLATKGASIPKLAVHGSLPAGGLDNTQEIRLAAKKPLPRKAVQRVLPSVLGGSMAGYSWTINGAAYPNKDSLDVMQGERVGMDITNPTGMSHPMHLHGHVFEVVEVDGKAVSGAVRDTVLVPPKSTMKIVFDANNPGVWAYHCHILYHMATGMFTVLKYGGADTKYWRPDMTPTEMKNPLQL